MPRDKSNKTTQSIRFDDEVLKSLVLHCRKNNVLLSTFVNSVVRKIVMSEYEFYRQMSIFHAIELSKFQCLKDTAEDKPGVEE